jgi:hypothetical protein
MSIDTELLNKALENSNNDDIINLTYDIIENSKIKLYRIINLDDCEIVKIQNQLKNYIFIDTIDKLKIGNYLRWIKVEEKYLYKGGFLLDIIIANENINLLMKNITNKTFTIVFNDIYLFKKISNQENIILKAMEYLQKK